MSELERVRQQLLVRKGQWRRVAMESGVAHRAIYNVVYAKNDPRTSTIQALAKWLHEAEVAERGPRLGKPRAAVGASEAP